MDDLLCKLIEELGDRVNVKWFDEYKELLRIQYKKEECYLVVIGEEILKECLRFVKQEREMNLNSVHLSLYCLFGSVQIY